jgi:hypothetical protein
VTGCPTPWQPPLQDCPEGEAAHHGGLNADAAAFEAAPGSAPMAFGPGGAYFLSGAAAQAPYGGGYGADSSTAANQRLASLPAYLPKAFSAAPFAATMPGLQEGGSCRAPTVCCYDI